MIAQTMILIGNFHGAQKHAMRAQEYAEALSSIYAQAGALYIQAQCLLYANFSKTQILVKEATQLLISCGLEGGALDLALQTIAAEVHILKTEYLKSRHIQVSIVAATKLTRHGSLLANLAIARIDIACGIDSGLIRKNLDQCLLQCRSFYGWPHTQAKLGADHGLAELCLRDGDLSTANVIFTRCFAGSQNVSMDTATACLERLADLSTGMNNTQTTIRWAGIFLVLALRSKDKLAIMKAFRCLGQISAVQGDDKTALSLFNVALDGFTFMDVHQWRADCMVRIANIRKHCGEVLRAVGLWKAARPLFARSSQDRDVARIDANLATVEASILEHYERELLKLAELNVPTGVLTTTDLETSQVPASEEEDQELVDGEEKSLQVSLQIAV
jgi:hypothetical protein